MGIFNSFGAMSGQFAARQERDQIASALAAELQTPGKLDSILQAMNRDAPGTLQQWIAGQTTPVPVSDLQQGLGKSGLIESLSQRTNMPPGVVKSSLAILMPLAIHHLASQGHITADAQVSTAAADQSDTLLQALR